MVWAAGGAVAAGSTPAWFPSLAEPPGTPPAWLLVPAWTVPYPAVGVAAWLVWRRIDVGAERKRAALRLWGWQLLANSLWYPAFFGLHSPALGFLVAALLLAATLLVVRRFAPLQPAAALLMLCYALCVVYAAYLDAGFWWLNRA